MSWLPPATPEEKLTPGWAQARHDEWVTRWMAWRIPYMQSCGYFTGKLGKGEHAPPVIPEED